MNKLLTIVSLITLTTLSVSADLISVTATGNTYYSTSASVAIGVAVDYTFQFDTEQDGSYTYNNTLTYRITDNYGYDYFYADFLGDFVLPDYGINPGSPSEYNYGIDYPTYYDVTALVGGSGSHIVEIYSYSSSDITGWQVGTALYGYEATYKYSSFEYMYSNLTITSMSNVPEPSTLALMFSGISLLGLNALRLLKRRKSK